MKAVYFAWVRERIGVPEEMLDPPLHVTTIADLMGWLKTRDEAHAQAFTDTSAIRAAIDHTHVPHSAAIGGAREVAFFPPMTGG